MIDQLIHRIKVQQAEIKEALALGGAPTWESYQRLAGEYRGLQNVLDMVDNMLDEEKNAD